MKYIKTYEDNNNKPNIGDYVVCKGTFNKIRGYEKMNNFIENNIGKITHGPTLLMYTITYNIPKNLKNLFYIDNIEYASNIDNIEFFSSNKKNCETYIISKNYNL